MPPLSVQSTRDAGTIVSSSVEPFYTDDDLVILHDIVVLAQQILPKLPAREQLPTNALFKAYYDILPRIGIDADHDSRYARILFKIGNLRGFDGTLFEKFEEVLFQRGITLEFDGDEHEDLRSGKLILQEIAENQVESDTLYQDENQPQLPRRNSESSVWDLGNEAQAIHSKLKRRNRSASPHGPNTPAQAHGMRSFVSQATRAVSPEPLPEPPRTTQKGREERAAHNVRTWLEASEEPPRRRGRSVSTHGSIRILRHLENAVQRGRTPVRNQFFSDIDEYRDGNEDTAVSSASEMDDQLNSSGIIHEQVQDNLLETKAAVISHHYFQIRIVKKLRLWRHLALQSREYNNQLELKALRHDSLVLLRQAFYTWSDHFRSITDARRAKEAAQEAARQQELERERRFANYERRAEILRNDQIKRKMLALWAQAALKQVQVTSAAKRHILRARAFNAWRNFTVANEEKVRKMRLKKFLNIWKTRAVIHETNTDLAYQIYDDNLLQSTYRKWFHEHKIVNFQYQSDQILKQRALLRWVSVSRAVEDTHRIAEDERQLNLAWNAWSVWKGKAEMRAIQMEDADYASKVKICRNALSKWRRQTQFVPAEKILRIDVNSRLLRDTFSTWLLRTRQERQASEVDRSRILREALTTWRHGVRCKRLRDISDDRAVAKTFKKWRLAAKLLVTMQLKRQQTMYTYMEVWYDRFQNSRSRRWEREELARRHDNKITATLVLRQWYASMYDTSEIEAAAAEFHAPKALSRALVPWRDKVQHTMQLQRIARDAQFYFLSKKILKRWRSSTEAAKREKRKVAYAQVRRMTKINLARDMVSRWRERTEEVTVLRDQAEQIAYNKTVIIGMNLFDQWRGRTEEMVEMESLWREHVQKKFFNVWKNRSWAFQNLNIEAKLDFQERRQSRAVRKWSLRAIQIKSQTSTATEVREKNTRKSFRKMFNYWRQRTAQQRPIVRAGTPPGTDTAENWSDFGDDDMDMDEITRRLHDTHESARTITLPFNPVTPKPGYMGTPSRRSERVIAAVSRFSSTTPRAPLSTPLERQLRAGYFGGSLRAFRRGRSTLGMDAGFADIQETGTNNDL